MPPLSPLNAPLDIEMKNVPHYPNRVIVKSPLNC